MFFFIITIPSRVTLTPYNVWMLSFRLNGKANGGFRFN